jgi:serine/threonine-protein phosphatase 6 regulatory ankyrin repeat subunit B
MTTSDNRRTAGRLAAAGLLAAGVFGSIAAYADPIPAADAEAALRGDPALVLAARYGQQDTVRLLLDQGTAIESRDGLGRTALIAAAGERDDGMVALLLGRGADMAAADSGGATALMHAAAKGWQDNARLLLDAGASLAAADVNGETALSVAVRLGRVRMVEFLLARGADPNQPGPGVDSVGYTPLMRAVERDIPAPDALAMVRGLLAGGAEPNVERAKGETAYTLALRNGQQAAAAELLARGARDEMPYAGLGAEQALLKAIRLGDADKVEILFARGVDPGYRDPLTGITPLASAAWHGNIKIMGRLIERGAGIDDVPWGLSEQRIDASSVPLRERNLLRAVADGDTALLMSIRRGDIDAVWALLDKGADIRLPNRDGESPGLAVARTGDVDIMRALLTKGLDPNANEPSLERGYMITSLVSKGAPPPLLVEAVRSGHAELSALLLDAGADPNMRDGRGGSPLYWAAATGQAAVVELLLARGADIHLATRSGETPLVVAAQNGHERVVQALLEHGANPRLRADDALALEAARENGHTAVVRLLTAATVE